MTMYCMDMNKCPVLNQVGGSPMLQYNFNDRNQQRASTPHDSTDDRGYLAIGEVIAVHPKRYTVDVKLNNENTKTASSKDNEGRHAARIGVSMAGFSNEHGAPYGEMYPIHRGDKVLLGFIKNDPHNPVVLRVFHDTTEDIGDSNYRNILPNVDTEDEDITDYLSITRIQDFHKVDKDGNFEISSHTKTFFIGQESNFDEENFDYEDLSVKTPADKSVIDSAGGVSGVNRTYDISSAVKKNAAQQTVQVAEGKSNPKKYMAVFRDAFKDTVTNWLRVIVDAKNTALKIIKSQQKANRSTCIELGSDGSASVKRQLDTRVIKGDGAKVFSKITMDSSGKITIQTIDKTKKVDGSTSTATPEVAAGDSDSSVAASQASNIKENNVDGLAVKSADAPFTLQASDTTTVPATIGTSTKVNNAYIAPQVDDIQLFKFPEQTFSLLRFSDSAASDTATADSMDNSSSGTSTTDSEAPTSSESDSGTTTTNTSTSTTSDTIAEDASTSVKDGETAQTIITIDPNGGRITIKTTSALSIDALKGISLNSDDGAVSISAKKGIKINSSEGYFYTKVKKQMVLQNDNASMGATALGDITTKNNMGAMNITASGEGQIGNMAGSTKFSVGGNISTMAPKITNAAASVSTTGSQKMMGGITSIGSLNQMGRVTINGRPAVVAGDRDSHGYRNFALFSNFVVAMVTQFAINQVVGRVAAALPKAAALIAIVDLCAGGFAAMKEAGWKGVATSLEDAAKGAIFDENSPFHGMLMDYCDRHGYGTALSVAAQVQFLTDPEPPGMGLSVSEALESIGYDYLEEKAAAWGGAAVLWTAIGSPNGMKAVAEGLVGQMADQVSAALEPDNLMNMFEGFALNKLQTMSANMGCNVKIVEENGYYNVVSTYDGTTSAVLNELTHIVDTSKFSEEGKKKGSVDKGNATIAAGDDTVPVTVSGDDTVAGNNVVNPAALRLDLDSAGAIRLMANGSGGSSSDETIQYNTIEDRLLEINEYYSDNIFDAVFRTEQYVDKIMGTNSAQYAYTNRRKQTKTGGTGASGGGASKTVIEPAEIKDRDQMVDRFIKRLVAANSINQLNVADQAVRYACSAEMNAEIESAPTAEEIEDQQKVANGIIANDVDENEQKNNDEENNEENGGE